MRKHFFVSAVLLFALLFNISATQAQVSPTDQKLEYKGSNKNLAVMVTDAMHFNVAVETAEQLYLKENKLNFEIVMVGILAKEIVENAELKSVIERAISAGAKLVVCEYALDLLQVDKSKVDKRISITPNAWIYMFELQDKGFNTLTIQP